MKQILNVNINNYKIEISDNKLEKLKSDIDELTAGKKRLIVISKKVHSLYKNYFSFNKDEILILPDGEKEKNYKNFIKIQEKAYQLGLTRQDMLIAIGGGVVGDITGFAASTFMRGIDYIQVPTTLLSMVDSSVGGKTAIDIKNGKNIIGTFYQPKAVFVNINFLKTLSSKELKSGLGEILKYAFIEDSCGYEKSIFFFEYLSLCYEKFYELEAVTLIRMIDYCLKLKIAVVEADEKEASLRKILNLGHTLAHALESITNYTRYTHGEAVIYGILFALNTAYKKGLITYSYYRLSMELLEKYNIKNISEYKKFSPKKIVDAMKKDKKSAANRIVLILPCAKKMVKEFSFSEQEVYELLKG